MHADDYRISKPREKQTFFRSTEQPRISARKLISCLLQRSAVFAPVVQGKKLLLIFLQSKPYHALPYGKPIILKTAAFSKAKSRKLFPRRRETASPQQNTNGGSCDGTTASRPYFRFLRNREQSQTAFSPKCESAPPEHAAYPTA